MKSDNSVKEKTDFISSIWDFSEISRKSMYATHSYHVWRGKLIPQLLSRIISRYSNEKDIILDNFCGSGTSLIESKILKRHCIGIDVSPLACLISNVKSTPLDSSKILKKLNYISKKFISQCETSSLKKNFEEISMEIPEMKYPEKWFKIKQLIELLILKNILLKIKDDELKSFFIVALSSIINQVSQVDPRSIDHIVSLSTKKPKDVWHTFKTKIEKMIEGNDELNSLFTSNLTTKSFVGDARSLSSISFNKINLSKDNCVDLIISHPPYLGNISYPAIAKLSTWILGNDFAPDTTNDLSSSKLTKYLENMKQVLDEMYRVLKLGKYAVLVIGDTRQNGGLIPTSSHLISLAERSGFQIEDIFIWVLWGKAGMKVKRRGNFIDHNYIVIMKKLEK